MLSVLSVLFVLVIIALNDQQLEAIPSFNGSFGGQRRILTNEPTIGILTQEPTGKISKFGSGQYVLTTYVDMVEAAGARAVPFRINQTPQEIVKLFNSINGLILPGGHVKLQHSKYATVGKQLFELAKKANDKGSVFPIWGECLGLELVALLASGKGLAKGQYDTSLFKYTYAKNMTAALKFTKEYKNSRLFGRLPPEMTNFMTTRLRSWHNHNKALTPAKFKSYKGLTEMFRVLTTTKDMKGVEFISTMEAKKYPFFLLHWHPTKTQQANNYNIDTNQEAVWNAQYLTNVFINVARTNDHAFADPNAKNAALISNYKVTSTNKIPAYFIPM